MSITNKEKVMEDKYAKNAKSFKNETAPAPNTSGHQQMIGLGSDLAKQRAFEEANKQETLFRRKMKRIFGAVGDVQSMFFAGFKMGFVVGGIFGGLLGTYYSVAYRQILYIPMAAIGSGCSFGFFMGIGMVMRTEMEGEDGSRKAEYYVTTIDRNGEMKMQPMYSRFEI